MICSLCQTENPAEAAFCRNCGAPLAAPRPAEAYRGNAQTVPVYTAPQKVKNPSRWPISAGLLALFGFLGYLTGLLLHAVSYRFLYSMPVNLVLKYTLTPESILTLVLALAAAVLFLAPTKKIPVLSALPRLLYSLILPVLLLANFLLQNRTLSFTRIVSLALTLVLPVVAILYFIGTLIKSKSAVLPAIHLAVSIFYGLFLLIAAAVELLTVGGLIQIASSFFMRLSEFLPLAGFAVASFSLRKKSE